MPKKPKTDPVESTIETIDGASPDVVLFYVGGRLPRYVPARDLSGHDIARIAHRRALDKTRGQRVPRPPLPDAAALEDVATEVIGSGAFTREAPAEAEPPTLVEGDTRVEEGGEVGQAIETTESDTETPDVPADTDGGPA